MISAASVLQTAVIAVLRDDAAVTALVGSRIYASSRDNSGTLDAITLGPSDSVPFHRRELKGSSTTLQIDCWAQANDTGRTHMKRARDLAEKVSAALHLEKPTISGWHWFSPIEVTGDRAFEDPDGVTAHVAISIRADLGPA
jgi:hypothetical protein